MRIGIVFIAFLAMLGAAIAQNKKSSALSQEQMNVLKHMAEAMVLGELCPRMKENKDISFMAFVKYKLTDDRIKDQVTIALRNAIEKAREDTESLRGNPDAACGVALFMFGPTGENVQNLMFAR